MRQILISQKEPLNRSAYSAIETKFGAKCVFRPFFVIEPLSLKEFKAEKIDPREYSAVIFSSRVAIDAYFSLCEALRFKVPETMKYFCTTEVIAMYLQKHIVYRKRKIFFGDGTFESIVSLIGTKHRNEKFFIAKAENSDCDNVRMLFDNAGLNYATATLVRPVDQDIRDIDFSRFDIAVLYNPHDVRSLLDNFPDFKQGALKFVTFGKGIVKSMKEAGFSVSVQGPTPEVTSASKAIAMCLENSK
ncbi:MAG: uroporphyrinogen-III synthase [Bacteroidales bacterium]|nr:uroporphyrinogen-III synthase [Bacteroidales bacterium]